MILAHGIDLVDVAHSRKLLAEPGGHWLARCFTLAEQEDAGTGHDRAERLSARFAVKEAVMKALGTGFGKGVGFLSIEVLTTGDGPPAVRLHEEAARRAEALGIRRWLVSASHEGDFAIASVIALGDQSPR
jgi:holo-[acyl-carrier protein] synthase